MLVWSKDQEVALRSAGILLKKNALLQGHPRLMESESVFYQEAEMTFIHINVGEESIRVHRTDLWER